MSKAGCSIALVGAAATVAAIFYALAPSMVELDQFFSDCTPSCEYQGSAQQVVDFFPALLICVTIIGLVIIMRMPERSEPGRSEGDQIPK